MLLPDEDRQPALEGKQILLVEDEMILAMSLQALLEPLGCHIVKAARLASALEQAQTESLDGVLLDINLGGTETYAVADALAARDVPFIFLTGYHPDHIKAPWHNRPILEKPFDPNDLECLMAATFAPSSE